MKALRNTKMSILLILLATLFALSACGGAGNDDDDENILVITPIVQSPIDDQTATLNSPFEFTFPESTFFDPNLDPLSYTATGMPTGITFDAATRTFSGIPVVAGRFDITLTATDSTDLTATDNFEIVVQ